MFPHRKELCLFRDILPATVWRDKIMPPHRKNDALAEVSSSPCHGAIKLAPLLPHWQAKINGLPAALRRDKIMLPHRKGLCLRRNNLLAALRRNNLTTLAVRNCTERKTSYCRVTARKNCQLYAVRDCAKQKTTSRRLPYTHTPIPTADARATAYRAAPGDRTPWPCAGRAAPYPPRG